MPMIRVRAEGGCTARGGDGRRSVGGRRRKESGQPQEGDRGEFKQLGLDLKSEFRERKREGLSFD